MKQTEVSTASTVSSNVTQGENTGKTTPVRKRSRRRRLTGW